MGLIERIRYAHRAFCGLLAPTWLVTVLFLGVPSPGLAQDDATCTMCHGSPSMFQDLPNADSLVVTPESLAGSVHGRLGLSCVMCHQDLMGSESFPHATDLEPAKCDACHADVSREYTGSLHGYALSRGNPRAPTCSSCHGSHDILSSTDPRSRTHRVRLPGTCANCHSGPGLLTDRLVRLPQPVAAYTRSVHGQGAERGVPTAASCSDCHGVHDLRDVSDPASSINHMNVSATCGQCHPDIQLEYDASIHGRALKAGVRDSPTCTDCHGEHLILSPRDPEAKTADRRMAIETCGECHDDPIIVAKYNLQSGVVGSYVDSYHGWATRRGAEKAASCVDCHTAHSVLPAADSASVISPANVVTTCRKCHPDADMRFVESYSHESASISANPINRIIRSIYLWAIALIIGGMVVHNLVVMNYYIIERRKAEKGANLVLRLDAVQLVQHLVITLAFAMLVVTGFALRFPEAWWVERLTQLGMTEVVRADLHRIFAVILIATAVSHVYYVFFTDRGRVEFRSIRPRWRDLKDVFNNIGFHIWRRKQRVEFGRYDYMQKAEYWALVWGTIVMIITGFVLWFPTAAVKILPAWAVPAAQTIHYYEAWLATLAVLVWHLFFAVLHPDEYPMTWTWLTGKMTKDMVKKHHGAWYDEIESRGEHSDASD